MSKQLVTVYGSLKKNYGNHGLLAGSRFVAPTLTPTEFTMLNLGAFPGLIEWSTAIVGEVYEVDSSTFVNLDRLEGYPHFYNRKLIPTEYGDAWIYFLNGKYADRNKDFVPSGEWTKECIRRAW